VISHHNVMVNDIINIDRDICNNDTTFNGLLIMRKNRDQKIRNVYP